MVPTSGEADPRSGGFYVANDVDEKAFVGSPNFYYLLKFRAGTRGQSGYEKLNRRNLPWVYFKFQFTAENGIIQTNMASVLAPGDTESEADLTGVPSFFLYKRWYDLDTKSFKITPVGASDMTDRARIKEWMETISGTITGTPHYP